MIFTRAVLVEFRSSKVSSPAASPQLVPSHLSLLGGKAEGKLLVRHVRTADTFEADSAEVLVSNLLGLSVSPGSVMGVSP